MDNIKDYNICIFGDSVSKGVYIENGAIIKIEKNAVNLVEEHYGMEITNNSVFGQSLKRIYDKKLIDKYLQTVDKSKKNVLVFSIGGNDCDFDWAEVGKAPANKHESKTDINLFKKYLEELTVKLLDNNIKVIYTNLFPIDGVRYFNNGIAKSYEGREILYFLNNDVSNITRHQECFNEAIIKTASKLNIPVFDIRTPFLMDTCFLKNISYDGIHPNEAGHKEIAKLIIKNIDELLKGN